ncbi:MAG: AraC family transcriptional regulator [Victivallales bacterium]
MINPPTAEEKNRLSLLKPFVRQTGDDQRSPWFMRGRKLLDYLLVYIGDGYGIFSVGEKTFKVGVDDIVWIPPDTIHEMRGTSERMNCIYIHFDLIYDPLRSHWNAYIPSGTADLSQWKRLMHPAVDDASIKNMSGIIHNSDKPAVRQLMKQICIEHKRSGGKSYLLLSGMMTQLVSMLITEHDRKGHVENIRWMEIQESASRIRMSGEKELDLKKIASYSNLSVSHFRKLFREEHGISPRKLHNQAKLQIACEQLIYSKQNISEIAQSLGFSNVHNFSRAFKKQMKTSPRNYRKVEK